MTTTKQTPCQPCVSDIAFEFGDSFEIVRNIDGRTGFQHQVLTGNTAVSDLMTNDKFKPEMMWIQDLAGLNALDLAARSTDTATVKTMIDFISDKEACLKSVFHSIVGETLEAFVDVITNENVNTLRDGHDNSLFMYAIINQSMQCVRLLIETFNFTDFMHVRNVDNATALHLVSCLSNLELGKYILSTVGQEMADAIGMTVEPGQYNTIHFLCRYASFNVFSVFIDTFADFSGFDEACAARTAVGSQAAQLALVFDEMNGPEKAYVLESITSIDNVIYNQQNIINVVTNDRAKKWLRTRSLGYNVVNEE
ncbi:ankyrin repeat-containing protein [European chub iridovirus]|nr:ankyrin repeat-containing protein [European chub iridovirus]